MRAFNAHDVRYLIVGAYALGVHGRPRATGDPGVWIDAEAWPDRVESAFGPMSASFIGRDAFIRTKRATGRAKDLGDVESLG